MKFNPARKNVLFVATLFMILMWIPKSTLAQGPTSPPGPGGSTASQSNPLQVAILRWYPANQTAQFPAGSNPFGIAFDGSSMWVFNVGSHSVSKVRASDGATLGTFSVGVGTGGIAFDGANIWVANRNSGTVSKF